MIAGEPSSCRVSPSSEPAAVLTTTIKTGLDVELDIERIIRVRETFGSNFHIRVDGNQGYTAEQYKHFFNKTSGYVEFSEQPLRADNLADMRSLPEQMRQSCAADESLLTPADVPVLFYSPRPFGIFNIKLMKCGGINPGMEIAGMAHHAGIVLMWGCMDESVVSIAAALHAALASPATRYLDLDGSFDLAIDIAEGGFILEDGNLRTTDKPGLGVIIENQNPEMMGSAVILTNGLLESPYAKTAHGLIRGTKRFKIQAVIDNASTQEDSGVAVDGIHRNIPIFKEFDDYLAHTGELPDYAIIGVALVGGHLNKDWQVLALSILKRGISIVSGMHMLLGDIPEFQQAARENSAEIIDVRRHKPYDQLHNWSGDIYDMKIPRIAVLGTDCALGKRTTSQLIIEVYREAGFYAEMIKTGQTCWLQGNP
ncbi:MAG: DUF1611 domain-containing protein [Desulfobacterales bacterium]|nr:DUF1611 domain-containing protein [Desulfobacterales bacterium]